jgi:putative NADH-flavin reductase
MDQPKILVFGGTGPAGICLLRELVYRQHHVVIYARNPSKIPEELASNTLIEVSCGSVKGSTG